VFFLVSTVGGVDLRDREGGTWTLLTGHGRVLVEIACNSRARVRDIGAAAGLAERTVQAIIADLEAAGYLSRSLAGRRAVTPSTPTARSGIPPRPGCALARSSSCWHRPAAALAMPPGPRLKQSRQGPGPGFSMGETHT
jgi:hypothetical protein